MLNLKSVSHKQHTVESYRFNLLCQFLPFDFNCPQTTGSAIALCSRMFNVPQWGSHGVFRKCQGYLLLINAIYNPAQKCNLTLFICSGFGAANLKQHGNDCLFQPPCSSLCAGLSLKGLSPAPPDGIHLFYLFSQGMEPGMYQLRFHPKSGTHFVQSGFLLFNPWVLAHT